MLCASLLEAHSSFQLTRFPVNLVLRNDDLTRIRIVCVLYRVTHDTDDPDDLAHLFHTIRDVARVTDQLLAAGNLPGKDTLRQSTTKWLVFKWQQVTGHTEAAEFSHIVCT